MVIPAMGDGLVTRVVVVVIISMVLLFHPGSADEAAIFIPNPN